MHRKLLTMHELNSCKGSRLLAKAQLSLPLFLLLLRLARNCGTKSFENLQGY